MAISCNSFDGADLLDTALAVGCKSRPANLGNSEIDPLKFLFLVVDLLAQLGVTVTDIPSLEDVEMCDAAQTLQLANCATQFISFPPNVTPAQLQAVIVYMLNEAICAAE